MIFKASKESDIDRISKEHSKYLRHKENFFKPIRKSIKKRSKPEND